MANSQNGWPVDTTGANEDRDPIYGNVKVPNGVLKGDVAVVMRWVARRFDDTVEKLVAGTCWGWFVKPIEGSATISNHASGTAIDLNADQHPVGVAAGKNFSGAQIAACHAIVKAAGGVVRWGGDYTGRPDPMHWEIVGSKAAVAALARKIEEEDVALTAADVKTLANTDNVFKAPAGSKNADGTPNEYWSLASYVTNTYNNSVAAKTYASQALAAVKALANPAAIAAAVVAALPKDTDDISQAEVTTAVEAAFAKAFSAEAQA